MEQKSYWTKRRKVMASVNKFFFEATNEKLKLCPEVATTVLVNDSSKLMQLSFFVIFNSDGKMTCRVCLVLLCIQMCV